MSRALGDAIAQKYGVVAVPEVSEYQVQSQDKFVVVCSDGV